MQSGFEMESSESTIYQEKSSVNIRLSTDIIETMDEVLFYANKEMRNKRKKLTKSDFYEIIFREIVNEYKLVGKESRLWKTIVS
jgi:hypothetical protein